METTQMTLRGSRKAKEKAEVELSLARYEVDVVVVQRSACEDGAMRMEGRAGDGGGAVVMEETRVGLEGGEIAAVHVERLDLVAVRAHTEHGGVFVHAQCSEGILCGVDGGERVVHSQIPKSDFAVATARDQLPQASALHVDICDPLLVFAPDLDHGCGWF